jgi:hypothetical protein
MVAVEAAKQDKDETSPSALGFLTALVVAVHLIVCNFGLQ